MTCSCCGAAVIQSNPGSFRNYSSHVTVTFTQVTFACGHAVAVNHSDERSDQELVGCSVEQCDRMWEEHLDNIAEGRY